MSFKTVLWGFDENDFDSDGWERLEATGVNIVRVRSPDEVRSEIANADALLVKLGLAVDAALIEAARRLKYVAVFGTDTSRVDTRLAASRGIVVENVAGYSTEAVAEFAIGAALDHLREFTRARRQADDGNFETETFRGLEIRGRTWGVLGLGRIGSRIAELAAAFGADVGYWSRTRKPDREQIRFFELEELLERSEVVSVSLPLTVHTEGILSAERLQRIRAGVLLLVLAPVELLDLRAAYELAAEGRLTMVMNHSYELSVEDVRLLTSCQRCILYPPISYQTLEAKRLRQEAFIERLEERLEDFDRTSIVRRSSI